MLSLFRNELRLARRIGGAGATGLVFMLALVALAPFALGPDKALLSRVAPAMLWIAALLATLIGLDRLFQADEEDGALALHMTSALPLEALVLAKCAAHFVATGLPLVAATPFFALMLGLDGPRLATTAASLAIGAPALTLIGAIGAALTATLRRGGLLLAVLVLPFSVPVLIFGAAAASGGSAGAFALLAAMTLGALALAPFAAAAALRAGRD